ncbi:hypothetical protein CDIK_1611 [Cucumispora dikerogammari]|nr:hypothetical protein CDIK_1611 [Cucumispora dikerogammari]
MSLFDIEREARQSGNTNLLETIIPQILQSTPQKERIYILSTLLIKKGQSHYIIKKSIKQLYTEDPTLNTAISLLKLCEGHVFLENERIFLSVLLKTAALKKYYETNDKANLKAALNHIYEINVDRFVSVNKIVVLEFLIEQLRLAVLCKERLKAEFLFRKFRPSLALKEFKTLDAPFSTKILYYLVLVDYSVFMENYQDARDFILQITLLKKPDEETNLFRKLTSKTTSFLMATDIESFAYLKQNEDYLHNLFEIFMVRNTNYTLFLASLFDILCIDLSKNFSEIQFSELENNPENSEEIRQFLRGLKSKTIKNDLSCIFNKGEPDNFKRLSFYTQLINKLRYVCLCLNLRRIENKVKCINLDILCELLNEDKKFLIESVGSFSEFCDLSLNQELNILRFNKVGVYDMAEVVEDIMELVDRAAQCVERGE